MVVLAGRVSSGRVFLGLAVLLGMALAVGCPRQLGKVPPDALPGTEQGYLSQKPERVAFLAPSPYPHYSLEEFAQLPPGEDMTIPDWEIAKRSLEEEFGPLTWRRLRQVPASLLVPERWSTVEVPQLYAREVLTELRSHPEGELEAGLKLTVYPTAGLSQSDFFSNLLSQYRDDPKAVPLADAPAPAYLSQLSMNILETRVELETGESLVREYVFADRDYLFHFTCRSPAGAKARLWRRLCDYLTHSLTRLYRSPELPYPVLFERKPLGEEGGVRVMEAREKLFKLDRYPLPSAVAVSEEAGWAIAFPYYREGPKGEPVVRFTLPSEEEPVFSLELGWPVNLEPELFYPSISIWTEPARKDQSSREALEEWVGKLREKLGRIRRRGEAKWVELYKGEPGMPRTAVRFLTQELELPDPQNRRNPTLARLYVVVRGPTVYHLILTTKGTGHPKVHELTDQVISSFRFFGRAAIYQDDSREADTEGLLREIFGQ